ncbi:MAG: hypothetical protein V5A45_04630 [Haloarculaceae archaeon]
MTDTDFNFQIEARLTSHGVYVDEIEDSDGCYDITYESISVDSEDIVPHREIGRVINVFRDLHDSDWRGTAIEATVTDLDGVVQAHWHVDQEWFDELHNGDLTEVEFSENVIETIEKATEGN